MGVRHAWVCAMRHAALTDRPVRVYAPCMGVCHAPCGPDSSPPLTMLGPQLRQHGLALDERPPRLHEVIHDDDVPPRGVALLEANDAAVAVAHLREGEGAGERGSGGRGTSAQHPAAATQKPFAPPPPQMTQTLNPLPPPVRCTKPLGSTLVQMTSG